MLWYIAVGSALGGVSRYLLGGLVQRHVTGGFPTGTLIVNLTGSFLLGLLMSLVAESQSLTPELRALLTIGFCGGYTTFSAFSLETILLLQQGQWTRGTLYVLLSVVLALGGTVLGLVAGRSL